MIILSLTLKKNDKRINFRKMSFFLLKNYLLKNYYNFIIFIIFSIAYSPNPLEMIYLMESF